MTVGYITGTGKAASTSANNSVSITLIKIPAMSLSPCNCVVANIDDVAVVIYIIGKEAHNLDYTQPVISRFMYQPPYNCDVVSVAVTFIGFSIEKPYLMMRLKLKG